MDELLNPWSVHSIYDFSYYFCPECESKWQFKQGKLKLLKGIDNKTVRRMPPLLTLVHFLVTNFLQGNEMVQNCIYLSIFSKLLFFLETIVVFSW